MEGGREASSPEATIDAGGIEGGAPPEQQRSSAEPPPAFSGHLRGTEGIRGSLCVLIVLYHTYLYSSPTGAPNTGWPYVYGISRWQLGLPVFFMLSAFLLYLPFARSILRGTPRPAFGAYLANRFLRIFPAYWAILIAAAIAGVTVIWIPHHDLGFHLPTFLANLALVHELFPSGVQTGVPTSWSLAVEWVYYLLLPLLVLLALRIGGRAPSLRRRRQALLVPAAVLLVIGLAGHEWARLTATPDDPSGVLRTWHAVIDKSFPDWADLFAIGVAVAVLRVEFEDGRLRLPSWWRPVALGGWLAISAVAIWEQAHNRLEFHHYNSVMAVAIGLFFCTVVLWDGEVRRDPVLRVLEWRPFVVLGNMSLSVYLIHYPLIVFIVDKGGVFKSGYGGMAFNWALMLALVLPLAYLSHRFIELPFLRRKVRTKAPGPPPPVGLESARSAEPGLARA